MSSEEETVEVSLAQLKEWFEKAFEEGWSNYKESKDSVVISLLKEAKKHKVITNNIFDKWEYYANDANLVESSQSLIQLTTEFITPNQHHFTMTQT